MASGSNIYQRSSRVSPLRQCEIISNLIEVRLASSNPKIRQGPRIDVRRHQFAMVVSQDCDLEQDYKVRNSKESTVSEDKKLPSILFCELIDVATLVSRSGIGSKDWKSIQQNKNERYQFLEKVPLECDAMKTGIGEMAMDFKRYFTVPADDTYSQLSNIRWHKHLGLVDENARMNKAHRRCIMFSPYLEQVSTRFSYFQSRIALPVDHQSEP